MTRQRLCFNPRPEHGGHNCSGNSVDRKNCHQGSCAGISFCIIFVILFREPVAAVEVKLSHNCLPVVQFRL